MYVYMYMYMYMYIYIYIHTHVYAASLRAPCSSCRTMAVQGYILSIDSIRANRNDKSNNNKYNNDNNNDNDNHDDDDNNNNNNNNMFFFGTGDQVEKQPGHPGPRHILSALL